MIHTFLSILFAGTMACAPYQEGESGCVAVPDSIQMLIDAAEKGEAEAAYDLGGMYLSGKDDIKADTAKAIFWIRKAAEGGHAEAQAFMGAAYYDGIGLPVDTVESWKWWLKGAENGCVIAIRYVAGSYNGGVRTQANYEQALKWYLELAKYDIAYAASPLGFLYIRGKGTPVNYEEAFKWFSIAAENNDPDALCVLGQMYYEGNLEQDFKKAADCFFKASCLNNPEAQVMLSMMYYKGEGVEQDKNFAYKWYYAAKKNHSVNAHFLTEMMYDQEHIEGQDTIDIERKYEASPIVQQEIGVMYCLGEGLPKNNEESFRWFLAAAEQGYGRAQNNLAYLYFNGEGVEQNHEEALKWFHISAESGYAEAQNNLGIAYEDGIGVEQDIQEAIKWYKRAAEQGLAQAQCNLGLIYSSGKGVAKNYDEAAKWFLAAAEQKNPKALLNLGLLHAQGQGVPMNLIKAKRYFNMVKNSEKSLSRTDKINYASFDNFVNVEINIIADSIRVNGQPVPDMDIFFQSEKKQRKLASQESNVRSDEGQTPSNGKTANVSKEKVVQGQKIQAKKPKEHKPNVYDKFFAYSGMYSLSYLNAGYMYYPTGQKHLIDFSTLDFRLAVVGVKPLGVELCLSPFDTRVTYKPSVQIYFPVAKWFSIVPYAGLAVDASYVGTFFDKNYEYDKSKDFYMGAIGGIALNLTAIGSGGHFSFALKMEYRHPLIQPEVGTKELTGLYLGAQIQVGSIFKKKKITK